MTTDTRSDVLPAELRVPALAQLDARVSVLGSKSYTNRYIAIASLAGDEVTIDNALLSDDTLLFVAGIEAFGHVRCEVDAAASRICVTPTGQPMSAPNEAIFMGNAGTPLRFLISMAGFAAGQTTITGTARMQERPMADLLLALAPLGVAGESVRGNGSPPISVLGGHFRGGDTRISGAVSSQFTSSLLLNAVHTGQDVQVTIVDDLISKPYVDMTVAAMAEMGVRVDRDGYRAFRVPGGQHYRGGEVTVEPDASGMSYFLAAAAILGGRVRIPGIGSGSQQGDVGFVNVLQQMGCSAELSPDSIMLRGGELRGIDVDMSSMPDVVPTLAIVAAYAQGQTHISGIANLRLKECDRIAAVAVELRKMGIVVDEFDDAMTVHGGDPEPALIETYDDHRMAMSFGVMGLRTDGVRIRDPGCVAKSFPTFWQTLDGLRGSEAP